MKPPLTAKGMITPVYSGAFLSTVLCIGSDDGAVTRPLRSTTTNLWQTETKVVFPLHHIVTPLQNQKGAGHVRKRGQWQKMTNFTEHTWKTAVCMTENIVSAYCLLWVNVVQASGSGPPGIEHCSVVNFPANDDTLFSTSPSGVVKSSRWVHVKVPHKPRTLNTTFTLLIKAHRLSNVAFVW